MMGSDYKLKYVYEAGVAHFIVDNPSAPSGFQHRSLFMAEMDENFADFISRACNAHHDLLYALSAMVKEMGTAKNLKLYPFLWKIARAAIDRAEGKVHG